MPKRNDGERREVPCRNRALHSPHVYGSRKGMFNCPGGQKAVPVVVPTCKNPLKHRGHNYYVKVSGGGWQKRKCPGKK